MILVSGIDGRGLNSADMNEVKASASKFSIDGVKLNIGSSRSMLSLANAAFISEGVIRFVVADQNGVLSVHDYNVSTKHVLVKEKLEFGEQWELETQAGIHLDLHNESEQYIVVAAKNQGRAKICWFDLHSLKHLGEYELKKSDDMEVLALCPLQPCFEQSVAVAVGLTPIMSDGGSQLVILQGLVKTDANQSNVSITSVHEVHTIVVRPSVARSPIQSIDIVDCSSTDGSEFGARYKIASGAAVEYKEFRSGPNNIMARARLLLARGKIDEADELVSSCTQEELLSPFGSIHGSEVVLMRFKSMLCNKKILTGDSKDQVKDCLRRLSFGAVSGGPSGVKSLIEASQALRNWASEAAPYIRDFRMALSAMAMSIANALKGVSSKHVENLKDEMKILEMKAGVFKTIETVLDSAKQKVQLSSPLLRVNNHVELYNLLISQGAFKVAENVRQSENGTTCITPENVAKSVTKISAEIDPNSYCTWLQNVVFPGLTINHQVLETVFSWGCETADEFDRGGSFGIDASILLLEVRSWSRVLCQSYQRTFPHFFLVVFRFTDISKRHG